MNLQFSFPNACASHTAQNAVEFTLSSNRLQTRFPVRYCRCHHASVRMVNNVSTFCFLEQARESIIEQVQVGFVTCENVAVGI